MISISGGWAQWDWQLETFRAETNGVVVGTYTGELPEIQDLEAAIGFTLSDSDRELLLAEREPWQA